MPDRYVIVVGSTTYLDRQSVRAELDLLRLDPTTTSLTIVHGGSAGAEGTAESWGRRHDVPIWRFRADWDGDCTRLCKPDHRRPRADGTTFCPAEGYRRNKREIEHVRQFAPDVTCLAFYSKARDDGVDDLVKRARHHQIPVKRVGVRAPDDRKDESRVSP